MRICLRLICTFQHWRMLKQTLTQNTNGKWKLWNKIFTCAKPYSTRACEKCLQIARTQTSSGLVLPQSLLDARRQPLCFHARGTGMMWVTALQLRKGFKFTLVSAFSLLFLFNTSTPISVMQKAKEIQSFSFVMRIVSLPCFLCHCQGLNHLEKM